MDRIIQKWLDFASNLLYPDTNFLVFLSTARISTLKQFNSTTYLGIIKNRRQESKCGI